MEIVLEVVPLAEPKDSILETSSMPSRTSPKTTCLPSSHGVWTVVMKNWEPLAEEACQLRMARRRRQILTTRASVGHGEETGLGVLQGEVLVGELGSVDGLTAAAVA